MSTPLSRVLRDQHRVVGGLWVAVLAVYVLTAWHGMRQNTDTKAAALSAWRLGTTGSLDLSSYRGTIPWAVHLGDSVVTNRFPGVIAAGAPFYAIIGDPQHFSLLPASLAAAFWSAISVMVMYLVARRLSDKRAALVTAGIYAFATPTWSVSADALWTHGPAQALLLLGILSLRHHGALSGLLFGASVLVRPHLAVVAAVIGLCHLARHRDLRWFLRFGLQAAAGPACLLAYNWAVFGQVGVLGGYHPEHLRGSGVGLDVFAVNVLGTLISPERGILLLTPFLWLLIPGLRPAWAAAAPWVRWSALGGLAYLLTQLWLIRFTGGHGFYSYRTPIEALTLASPLLVLAYRSWVAATRGRRAWFFALVTISAGYHAYGAVLDPHRPNGGNPFRQWSAGLVAAEVAPTATAAFAVVSVGLATVAGVIIARRPRIQQLASAGPSASKEELLQPGELPPPTELPVDPPSPLRATLSSPSAVSQGVHARTRDLLD